MRRMLIINAYLIITVVITSCGGRDSGGGAAGTHQVRYEVSGGMGTIPTAEITYVDRNGSEQTIENAPLPWTYTFSSSPEDELSLTAILHGSGTNTLYVTIMVDDECYIEYRTFVTESPVSVSGTAGDILSDCPNNVP